MTKISRLLAVCLLHSAAFAIDYDQKTFLLPHNPIHTNNMEQTLFRTHRHNAALDQTGHVQVTALYGASTNRAAIGKYFGIGNGKNSFKVGRQVVDPAALPVVADKTVDLDGGYLVHDRGHVLDSQLGGTVTLLPKQTMAGVNLTYRQGFEGAFGRAFFQVSAPIVQVKNDLGLSIANPTSANVGGKDFSLADFFAGRVSVADNDPNTQTALTKSKMVAGSRSAAGVADLSVQLGYALVANETNHIDLSLRGIIPTGNKSTGEYVFEPLVGNNGHFGMGLGIDSDVTLWTDHERGRVHLNAGAAYNYIFESTEVRSAAVTRRREDTFKYNSYVLVGAPGATTLAPAANQLAQDFRVRPGSQLELNTGLSFHSTGGVSLNIGYNMNWRETERVYRKATNDFFGDNVIAAKAALMNASIPDNAAPGRRVGLVNNGRADVLYGQAVAPTAANAFPGGALQSAMTTIGAANGVGGVGANAYTAGQILATHMSDVGRDVDVQAGANFAGGGLAAPNDAICMNAYQAAAQLYAGSAENILESGALAVNAGNARAAAVVAASATARNLIQNVNNAKISDDVAPRQEALVTHVFGASLGYSFEVQRGFPVMLGVGGQYDLPHSSNAGLEGYKLFAKLGLSF